MTPASDTPSHVFITGANGFIARALEADYRTRGVRVSGVDLVEDAEREVRRGDVADPAAWADALEGVDILLHTAAVVSFTADPRLTWEVNVRGTQRLLQLAAERGVKRFVQFSSVAAMGWDYADGADETWPLRPNGNPYTDTKIASEHSVLAAHAGGAIETVVIRPGDVYGPLSRPWIHGPLQVMKAGQFILPSARRSIFTPIHIDDFTRGVVLASEKPEGAGQIFILYSGEPVTTAAFFRHHWRWLGRKGSPPSAPTALARTIAGAAGGAARLLGRQTEVGAHTVDWLARRGGYSIAKARRLLGFEPQISLEEGMRRCEAHLRETGVIS